ncbi:MAG: RNA polymerase-binding protein DksA [Chromatiales bacterium]|nr:RNA polymerase-binding protein DksA [Chromatiales bacterium]
MKKASSPERAKNTPTATQTESSAVASGQLSYLGLAPYQEKKGEEYMGARQIEHFRHILNVWKNQLIEEMERTVHHMRDEAANFPDPNDRASQESDFALELRTRDRERKLIKKIDESLRNLESSEYGFCEACGVEIGIRRLEARPTATLCIDCKTLDEIRERQNKG